MSEDDGPQLEILGAFRLRHDGDLLRVPWSAQRLLALLAVHRRPMRRPHAASLLWLDTRDRQARSNLRAVLSRLRRCPVPLVSSDAATVGLAADVRVDLWSIEDRPELLTADVLPGWQEEWLVAERERHRQRRLHALERICRQHRQAGEYALALEAGLTAIACEPLRESAHRHVIEVHLAEGNHAEALRQYERYRTEMRRELGLRPTPMIRGLVAGLLGRPADTSAGPLPG